MRERTTRLLSLVSPLPRRKRRSKGRVCAVVLVAVTGVLAAGAPALAQSLAGPFDTFNPWWLNPSNGTLGVTPGAQICIDLDGNGTTEACYGLPSVPPGTLTNLRLSPTRRILMAFGNTTNCGPQIQADTVYFFDVPDPPGALTVIDNACVPNGVNAGQIGFYDTGLCCDGLADIACPSLGLNCFDNGNPLLGVSPQRIAYVADQGDSSGQTVQVIWFDLNAGTHATTFPGFNAALPLTRVQVSPYGDAAFVQHDVGGASDSDYSVIDLCAVPRLGDPLSSIVGGALFNLDLPIATAEMIDNGGSDFDIRIAHPDLTGEQLNLDFTPCSGNPPPTDGACCRLDGCTLETSADCDATAGSWLGPDTDCAECPTGTLTINVNGPGSVDSDPAGISCPVDCQQDYAIGQQVELTATPGAGALFVGWGGDCGGNGATVQVSMDGDRKCTASFDLVADLAVTKVDDFDPVTAGEPLTYTITVTNNGPSDATGVIVNDSLPAGAAFDADASDPTCSDLNSLISCDIGTVPNGGSRILAMGVIVDPATRGNIVNNVSVSGDQTDLDPFNNSGAESTSVIAEADLSVLKLASPEPVQAGGAVFYQIEVSNNGPSSATNVEVIDDLPVGVTAAGGAGDPTQVSCGAGNGNVAVGESLTIGFAAIVDAGITEGTILTNSATVSATEVDPDPSNNTAMVDSTVTGMVTFPAAPTFTRVADTNTPIPQGTGNFMDFGGAADPALSDSMVVFRGRGVDQDGTYAWVNGVLSVVADTNTPIPGGTGTFGAPATGGFGNPSVDGDDAAFHGDDQTISQRGVYTRVGGVLDVVADKMTVASGANTPFSTLGEPSLGDGNVAFWAFIPALPHLGGIYYGNPSGITRVASQNTFIPGGGGRFSGFSSITRHKRGTVVFFGRDSQFNSGLYKWVGGTLSVVADRFTPIPGGVGNLSLFFETVAIDGINIAFRGDDAAFTQSGIYMDDCAGLRAIVDGNTPVTCGGGDYAGFGGFSTHGGNLAFVGFGPLDTGLYAQLGGRIVKVLEVLESLDGKTVSQIRLGAEGLRGNRVAFKAFFTDGSEGIYVAVLTASGVCDPFDDDADRDRDLRDVAAFAQCFSGDGNAYDVGCALFDVDGDGDIDNDDLPPVTTGLTGPMDPPPSEACCHQDGTCSMATTDSCEYVLNGTPSPGQDCADNPCTPKFGACCSFKGCFVTTVEVCNKLEGTFYPGEECFEVTCK